MAALWVQYQENSQCVVRVHIRQMAPEWKFLPGQLSVTEDFWFSISHKRIEEDAALLWAAEEIIGERHSEEEGVSFDSDMAYFLS